MKKSLIVVLAVAATVASISAQAQVYQWKDASGKTVVSDTPPPATVRDARALGGAQRTVVTGSAEKEPATDGTASSQNSAPQTMAEKELEFRKRQQEAREKAEQAEKEAAAQREKRDNCERARNNYRLLQSDTPVSRAGKDGQPQMMSAAQRQQEMERTRRIMQESCR